MAVSVLSPNFDVAFGRRVAGGHHFRARSPPPVGRTTSNNWSRAMMPHMAGSVRTNSRLSTSPRATSPSATHRFPVAPNSPGRRFPTPNETPRYNFQQQSSLPLGIGGFGGSMSLPIGSINAPMGAGTDAGLEAVLMSAKAQGKSTLCIWFHYLAGTGADWETGLKAKVANQLPGVEWYFPDAPMKPVTMMPGSMERAWFDQVQSHVTEGMATPGLEASVSYVHGLLRQAERHGFPANRILLGGMSQGGVLAMTAGLSYERQLAGIIAVSAWVPQALLGTLRQPNTPLMIGNGDNDGVIPLNVFKNGAKKLEQAGCSRMMKRVYFGKNHRWGNRECEDVKQFIQSVVS